MSKTGRKNKVYSAEFKIGVIMDMREHHLKYRETVRKFFHYFIGFDKGDVAVFTMADGTKHTYTYKEKSKV